MKNKTEFELGLVDLPQPHKDFIQYVAVPAAIERIQNTYKVIRYTTPLMVPKNKTRCSSKNVPEVLLTTGVPDTDLYIMVNWVNNASARFAASAIYCALDATTSR